MFELVTGFIVGFLVCGFISHLNLGRREEEIQERPEKMRGLNKQLELEKMAYTKINFHSLGAEVLQGATEAAQILVQGESWEKERQADAVVRIREVASELKGLVEWLKSDWVREEEEENGERYVLQGGKLIRSDDGNITFGK